MKTLALIVAMLLCGWYAAGPDEPCPTAPATAPALDATSELAVRGLDTGSLPEIQLLSTRHGRDLLSRVVACALPRGAALRLLGRDGTPYSFTGALGLAPGWAGHAPSVGERRRVTDCVRARAFGTYPA
ncbi:MAG TPA: hypothetical protein VHW23_27060 [Kofleriaceae bacterium]|jgi:hypothetical protein|nr:hypothetical protein [Kofleriaceae bacterium]